jgi:hypothetical protein
MKSVENRREMPADELSGAPMTYSDPVSNFAPQIGRFAARSCFGLAHTRYNYSGGSNPPEQVFISPLFSTVGEVEEWKSTNREAIAEYTRSLSYGLTPTRVELGSVSDGVIYTRRNLAKDVEKQLTHGRKGTNTYPADGMKCKTLHPQTHHRRK